MLAYVVPSGNHRFNGKAGTAAVVPGSLIATALGSCTPMSLIVQPPSEVATGAAVTFTDIIGRKLSTIANATSSDRIFFFFIKIFPF
jgi:hypothetical protein